MYPADITLNLIKQKFNPYKCGWGRAKAGWGGGRKGRKHIAVLWSHKEEAASCRQAPCMLNSACCMPSTGQRPWDQAQYALWQAKQKPGRSHWYLHSVYQTVMALSAPSLPPPADGHIHETRVDFKGNPTVFKWYTMGRLAFEMAYVLPDRKTV